MKNFAVKQPKRTRAHRVLFDSDLPFKPRTERNKMAYQRKAKHQNREYEIG